MGFGSWWHWLIVLAVVLLLFGGKKLPELMKGLGTGIKSFKKAVKDDEDENIHTDTIENSSKTIQNSDSAKQKRSVKPREKSKTKE